MSDPPKIIDRRSLELDGMRWTVNEFDSGTRLLHISSPGGDVSFNVHFNAQEWFDFQELITNP